MTYRTLAILTLLLMISGCASPPPKGYQAKRGTQKPYKIDGKWYSPVESSYGFEERGLASWYGRDFHGKKTSNGETYDMHAMTAAHKTLPMGTYVSVVRLDTGVETVVRVNDRGPFVRGRIIDLSFSAAKEIGIDVKGTAKVKITALGDKNGGRLVKKDYAKGRFFIQVGAFTKQENALRLKRKIEKKFGSTKIFRFESSGKTFYRVRIGPIGRLEKANKFIKTIEDEGIGIPFIVAD